METNVLGRERIGKLLRAYAIPSIISMLVNALYNIVDQIFIGQGVGYLGNGAANIIFPITIVFAAFALMFGDGSAAYMSLRLGANQKTDAAKGVANGIILSVVASIVFAAGVFAFFPQLLTGPIGRGDRLLPQYAQCRKPEYEDLARIAREQDLPLDQVRQQIR